MQWRSPRMLVGENSEGRSPKKRKPPIMLRSTCARWQVLVPRGYDGWWGERTRKSTPDNPKRRYSVGTLEFLPNQKAKKMCDRGGFTLPLCGLQGGGQYLPWPGILTSFPVKRQRRTCEWFSWYRWQQGVVHFWGISSWLAQRLDSLIRLVLARSQGILMRWWTLE